VEGKKSFLFSPREGPEKAKEKTSQNAFGPEISHPTLLSFEKKI